MKSFQENKLLIDFREDHKNTQIAALIESGRERGYVTPADILRLIPVLEDEIDGLEKIFAALHAAGISYKEDDEQDENPDSADAQDEDSNDQTQEESDGLGNLDPDDLVGLYFYDAARRPLLTAEEEIQLAQRVERGYAARDELSQSRKISNQRRSK